MPSINLPDGERLKPAEVQALRLVLEGLTAQPPAEVLSASVRTVQGYIYWGYRKLNARKLLQARRRLQEFGRLESVMQETEKEPAAK